MNQAIKALNNLSRVWAEVVWAVSWQAVLIVGGFAVVAWMLRRSSPSLRSWLWQIAAIKLLIMPLWGASMVLPLSSERTPGRPIRETPTAQPGSIGDERVGDWRQKLARMVEAEGKPDKSGEPRFEPIDWRVWPTLGWSLLVGWQVVAIFRQRRRLFRLLVQATPAEDPNLLAVVRELSERIGLAHPPRVLLIDEGGSPFVCDPRGPTLVLPRSLARSFPLDGLRPVLLHELFHIKRRDLIWGWVPVVARLLYVIHPAAHYVAYRARLERELACDQAAMVLTGQGAAGYASTLVEVVTQMAISPALWPASASSRLDVSRP